VPHAAARTPAIGSSSQKQQPEGQAEIGRQQRVGIGANRVEGDITEIEQAGEADDDVQSPGQHHIDEDLDAEVVDPFQRALEAEQCHHDRRIDDQGNEGEQAEITRNEARLPLDRRSCGPCCLACLEPGTNISDRQETADHGNGDEDRQKTPALDENKFVQDVLVGLQADEEHEQAKSNETGIEGLAQSPCHQIVADDHIGLRNVCHEITPSRLPADPEYRRA
jgi:hypothetical protein